MKAMFAISIVYEDADGSICCYLRNGLSDITKETISFFDVPELKNKKIELISSSFSFLNQNDFNKGTHFVNIRKQEVENHSIHSFNLIFLEKITDLLKTI